MLFIDFLKWWYGPGWALRLQMLSAHIRGTLDFFSLGTIVKTLFSPWRQNVSVTQNDQGIDAVFRKLIDNGISRLVGFWVRLFVLIAASFVLIAVLLFNLAYVITWPLIPLSSIILLTLGASL